MARGRALYLPALLVATVVACAAAVVTLLAVSKEAEATFPGKNGRIAYLGVCGRGGGICTINPGGGGNTKVTNGDEPSYSPNGRRIAYSQWDGHDSEIYTINVGGGSKVQVTHNATYDDEPSYLPSALAKHGGVSWPS